MRFSLYQLAAALLCACFAAVAGAQEFTECLTTLQQRARDEGLSDRLVTTLSELKYVPRVIELDRSQPEFTESFAKYMDRRVTDYRIDQGRKLLSENRQILQQLTRTYGVPPQYLVAFWGLESNYGAYKGSMPILDSLGTLACDQRRGAFFTVELFTALQLMDELQFTPQQMLGGWAGAIGHTQFMPSAYRQYAIDGDGDGKADLWNSVPDALTSAARYLQALGWKRELRWGREVRLPDGFDYQLSGLDSKMSLTEWRKLGVTRTNGSVLPRGEMQAALIVPAGHKGPKFLVYENFEVIMRWNRSVLYSLSVGHLADRINGAGRMHQRPPANELELTIVQVKNIQSKLQELGFDPGDIDGLIGPATQRAVQGFQKSKDQVADGHIDESTIELLGVDLAAEGESVESSAAETSP